MSEGAWQTPLGDAAIDSALAAELKQQFHVLEEDLYAHMAEHALEVELPFLQAQLEEFTFVPICVGVGTYQMLAQLGDAIAAVVKKQSEPVLIVASSDMNHYETDSVTRKKDHKAIEQMLARNPEGLYETVQRERITMCGYGPAVAMLTATRALGAREAELVKYATSADVSGDRETCVGYAGVVVR
jgi:AmmeMemoRadiSam system protein B